MDLSCSVFSYILLFVCFWATLPGFALRNRFWLPQGTIWDARHQTWEGKCLLHCAGAPAQFIYLLKNIYIYTHTHTHFILWVTSGDAQFL